jgi:hypothetical protein
MIQELRELSETPTARWTDTAHRYVHLARNLVVGVASISAQHRQQQPASFTQASERRAQLLMAFGSHEKVDSAVVVEIEGAE